MLAGLASFADKDLPTTTKVFGALAVLVLGAAAVMLLIGGVSKVDLGL